MTSQPDRTKGRQLMTRLIASISHDVPAALSEVITLGRTLKNRAAAVLAYFDRPKPATDRRRRSNADVGIARLMPTSGLCRPWRRVSL
jgi:hypothetical protein